MVPGDRVFIADLTRQANGPRHHASTVAFRPEPGSIKEAFHLTVSGRPEGAGGGVVTAVKCDATWITAFQSVPVPELIVDEFGVEDTIVTGEVQVPEVANCHAQGEWTVPPGNVLVISMGVHSAVDLRRYEQEGNPENAIRVSDRLLIVEPNPPAPLANTVLPPAAISGIPMANGGPIQFDVDIPRPAALPMPTVPTASLPMAGPAAVPPETLPPLPDDQIKRASLSPSPDIMPSPQSLHVNGRVIFDPALRQSAAECDGDCCAQSKVPQADSTAKTSIFRIPLGGSMAVEIRATVAPRPASSAAVR
jgi:hypothetical protein